MWDYKAPLQLLQSMPKKLSSEHLEKIQMVIDADKYKNSLLCGYELCGMYAPFCRGCKKAGIYPCAISYINMLKQDGMDIELDFRPIAVPPQADPVQTPQPVVETAAVQPADEVVEHPAQTEAAVAAEEVTPVPEAQPAVNEEKPAEKLTPSVHTPVKHKIRIAVARKKM